MSRSCDDSDSDSVSGQENMTCKYVYNLSMGKTPGQNNQSGQDDQDKQDNQDDGQSARGKRVKWPAMK